MIIDVTPKIIEADAETKLVMEIREVDAFYTFAINGKEGVFTHWTLAELTKSFLENKKASEMIKIWEECFISDVERWKKAIKTGIHPFWTKEMSKNENYLGNKETPYKMSKSEIKVLEEIVLPQAKSKVGKMELLKIVPFL